MSDARLRDLERTWRETGAVEDGAAFVLALARADKLPRQRLELLAYLGHEPASAALAELAPEPRLPRDEVGGPGARIYQWVLGFADRCPPEDRVAIARRCVEVLLRGVSREALADLEQAKPWAVMQIPAGIASGLVAQERSTEAAEEELRRALRCGLAEWLLGGLVAPRRAYSPQASFRVGEELEHARFGPGRVRSARGRQIEVDFADGRRQLAHRGAPEEVSPFGALDELLLSLEGAGLLDWIEDEGEVTLFRPWREGHHTEPELPRRLEAAARGQLRVILYEDTGGVACAWSSRGLLPVVYLSGEGEATCLARSPRDFFLLCGLRSTFMELTRRADLRQLEVDEELLPQLERALGRELNLELASSARELLAGYESERLRAWLEANSY